MQPTEHSYRLEDLDSMDHIRRQFGTRANYEPVQSQHDADLHSDYGDDVSDTSDTSNTVSEAAESPFSRFEYSVFFLLGVAMLWAWNMFLAAAPYFEARFQGNKWISNNFQAAEISVSTVTNLGSVLVLSKLQENASYPKRISMSLVINAVCFTVLAFSTFVSTSPEVYFGVVLVAIFSASLSAGLTQNGVFAYASGFGRAEYTQAIMAGQGVAGVLPPLTQIISWAAARPSSDETTLSTSNMSAFIYFMTATGVSVIALLAFLYLLRRRASLQDMSLSKSFISHSSEHGDMDPLAISRHSLFDLPADRTAVSLWSLFRKLTFMSSSVFVCFAVTMVVFPVFTAIISSVSGIDNAVFVPLAFLVWNLGDLSGRLSTLWPQVSLTHYPSALFCIAGARLVFIPLYFLCNVRGRGAAVNSDFFYLFMVQFLFGLSNGYLGSECMMGAGDWVLPEEREAAGGFMSLMLVGGLTVGSLLSFTIGTV